jgi:Arc/MetJ-type ribon-helix-helix transcriptional regulator
MTQLTSTQQDFVEAQIAIGRFRTATDVVQAAFELLDGRLREYAQLASAIEQAERGDVAVLDVEDIKRRGRLRMDG